MNDDAWSDSDDGRGGSGETTGCLQNRYFILFALAYYVVRGAFKLLIMGMRAVTGWPPVRRPARAPVRRERPEPESSTENPP